MVIDVSFPSAIKGVDFDRARGTSNLRVNKI